MERSIGSLGVGRLPSNRRASTRSPLIVVRLGFFLVPSWCQVASHFVHPIVPCTPETIDCDRPLSSLYFTCHMSLSSICSIIKKKSSPPPFRLTWNSCGFRIDRERLHVDFQERITRSERRAHLRFFSPRHPKCLASDSSSAVAWCALSMGNRSV